MVATCNIESDIIQLPQTDKPACDDKREQGTRTRFMSEAECFPGTDVQIRATTRLCKIGREVDHFDML